MVSLSAFIGVTIAAIVTAIANILIRTGIVRAGGFKPASIIDVGWSFIRLLLDPVFLIGFILYFVAALVWFRTIALAPLSIAYPLMVSLTFITVTIGSIIFWNEPLTFQKLVGLLVIMAGIVLTSTS